jgi:hypothetical protein
MFQIVRPSSVNEKKNKKEIDNNIDRKFNLMNRNKIRQKSVINISHKED